MTQQQLIEVMKYHLNELNFTGINPINENTIHNTILSATDGVGRANSKDIYRQVIRWTMKKNGHEDKPWATDWFEKSIFYLSSKIL